MTGEPLPGFVYPDAKGLYSYITHIILEISSNQVYF